jgi:hypothetical protein
VRFPFVYIGLYVIFVLYDGHLGRCKKIVDIWDREMNNTRRS